VETVFPTGSVAATPYRGCFYLPGVAHTQRWSDGSAQICLKFATDALERELQHILGRPYKGRIRFKPLMDLTAPESQGFLDALNLYERECARPTGIARQPLAAKHLEHLLMDTLLLAQPHNFSEALNAPPRAAAPKAVRQAIDVIEGHPETPLTVTDLARAAGVSVRSLQAGFQRHLETSPMAYLRDVRLGRVHEDLLSAPAGSTTVTDVAYKWGFVHVGRFTKEYRRKFGQLPSRTMRTTSV
jgi:AraC-like DNA-binding protein